MPPLDGKTGEEMVFIFFQGADCDREAYKDHFKAIQEKVPYRLWIAMPHIVGEMPIPPGLGIYVDDIKKDITQTYKVKVDKYIYGGHSLGGASIA